MSAKDPARHPMSKLTVTLMLVAVWVLMWGSASPANLLSGLVVVVSLFVLYPSQLPMWPTRRFRFKGVAVLVATFVLDLVVSNFWLVLAALGPSRKVQTALVWVDLQFDDPALLHALGCAGRGPFQRQRAIARAVAWLHKCSSQPPESSYARSDGGAARVLVDAGLELVEVRPIDQFLYAADIELIALFAHPAAAKRP